MARHKQQVARGKASLVELKDSSPISLLQFAMLNTVALQVRESSIRARGTKRRQAGEKEGQKGKNASNDYCNRVSLHLTGPLVW